MPNTSPTPTREPAIAPSAPQRVIERATRASGSKRTLDHISPNSITTHSLASRAQGHWAPPIPISGAAPSTHEELQRPVAQVAIPNLRS